MRTRIFRSNFYSIFKSVIALISILFCVLTVAIGNTNATENNQPIVDLYRSKYITIDDVNKKFGKEILEANSLLNYAGWHDSSPENSERIHNLMDKITNGIKGMGDFSYLNISIAIYLDGKSYFTIDVVDKEDKKRLSYFIPKPNETINDPDHLIAKWTEYNEAAIVTAVEDSKLKGANKCSVYHCILGGFANLKYKKYEKLFNSLVPKNKEQIIDVLRNDQDENKRAAAAFLLAHIKDGKELVKILIPSMYDSSPNVRNNVMRVLGATLEKVKVDDFPIDKAIIALDFPCDFDRNKALYILSSLANQPNYAKYIKSHAGNLLIDNLKMFQPNLHDNSYAVLMEISGKKYGERDYKAWQDWLDSVADKK